jgi:hypothetical protein
MEEFLRLQRIELIRQGAPELESNDWDVSQQQWLEDEMDLEDKEDDSLEEADLAFITSILESFSEPKSKTRKQNSKANQNRSDSFCATFTPEGTPARANAKQRVTPQKFNYKLTIKMPMVEQISCSPTVDKGGPEEFLEESDNKDENYTEETAFENTPTICSVTAKKKNSFAAWQPFIPSNWQEDSSQNSPAQHYGPLFYSPPCSTQSPATTNWSLQIASIDCSPLEKEEKLKPQSSRMHPTKTRGRRQSNQPPEQKWKPYKKERSFYNNNWSKPWPELSKMSKRTRTWLNEFPGHPEQSKQSKLWKPQSPFLDKPNPDYEVSEYVTGNKRWKCSPAQYPVPIQDFLLYDVQSHHGKNKILGEKVAQVVRQNIHWAQQASKPYQTPSWASSPRRWPPTCSSSMTTNGTGAINWIRKLSLHGDSHFSKRRSESKSKSESQKASKRYQESERQKETIKSERERGHQVKERQK